MKRIHAINGSPRKNQNTARLLDACLEGVRESGEEVEAKRIDLCTLDFTGCRSCFACKRIGGASYGKCAVKDGLYPVLEELVQADGLLFGSPVYYRNITGQLHAFFERLLFPYCVYSLGDGGIRPKRIPTGFVYTMNVTEVEYRRDHYEQYPGLWERFVGGTFGCKPQSICAFNTYQFDDYGKFVSDCFDEPDKRAWREAQFPRDLVAAREMGRQVINN